MTRWPGSFQPIGRVAVVAAFFQAAFITICAGCNLNAARAADFPERPLRLLVGQATGSATDFVARVVAARWGELLGQNVVVDNRPGAGESIAAKVVATATPDGYTNVFGSIASHAIAPAMYKRLPYDAARDFAPLSLVGKVPNVLVVHPSLGVTRLPEFAQIARAKPGGLNYASTGVGTSTHLGMELLKVRLGIDIVHVPYKAAGAAFSDLIAGQVAAGLFNLPSQLPFIESGKIRAVAVTSLRRNRLLPDVPTVDESGVPGYEVVVWYAVFTSARAAKSVQARLVDTLSRAIKTPQIESLLSARGVDVSASTPGQLAEFLRVEMEKWRRVVRDAGIETQ